jgi:hypothetical protein
MFKRALLPKLFLLGIIFIAILFRFYDVNWDQGQHLHPDERFLTMVGSAMKLPHSFADYLNPQVSTFNPANISYPFYVYGTFPVVLNKLLALQFGTDNYGDFALQGRLLSAFFDVLIVMLIFKTLELFEKKYKIHHDIKKWGALFYAIAVLPIQLSHFFAVDTFVNFFAFASFYFALRFSINKKVLWIILSAIFLGFAIGSKVSAVYIFPLILYFILQPYSQLFPLQKQHKNIYPFTMALALFAVIVYIVGRLADPYLFQNANFFDPRPSSLFLDNIKSLQSWSNKEAWFPPSVQWINKTPVLFALTNLVVFGIGAVYAALVIFGGYKTIRKYKHFDLLVIISWVGLFAIYQSIQFSSTMRYFLIIYPFLAILASIGFYELTRTWSLLGKGAVVIAAFVWPLFFFSIYTKPHSRTIASTWIYQNIPNGSVLLSEHWDDALPLSSTPPSTKQYTLEQLPVFDPDTAEKWKKMDTLLNSSDYLILSSNRGWGSIPTVPERYPKMTQYYKDLFANKTQYKMVAEFTSYPSLNYIGLPLSFPDDWSEEAFTVYDHPKVMIFQKTH